MIRINLLPEELRGRSRKTAAARREGVSALVVLFILALLAADAAGLYYVYYRTEEAKAATQSLTQDRDDLLQQRNDEYPEYEEMLALHEQLKVKEAILRTLDPPDRILWSEKLNMLCYIVHPDVFITRIQLTEEVVYQETPESLKRRQEWEALPEKDTEQPAQVMVPIITQTMTVTGVTTGDGTRERLDNFRRFWNDVQRYETVNNHGETVRFMDGFVNTRIGEAGLAFAKDYGGKEVGEFTIQLITAPMSGEAKI